MANHQSERCSSSFIVREVDLAALVDEESPIYADGPRESSSLVHSSAILSLLQSPPGHPPAGAEESKEELADLSEEDEI